MVNEMKNKSIISNIQAINPLWYFNHLSKEDKSYFLDHIDEIIKESEKYGIEYEVAINAPVTGVDLPKDVLSEAFTPVRSLVNVIEHKTKKKINVFSTETKKDALHIPIASDYIYMMDAILAGYDDVRNVFPLIRAVANYEFTALTDVTDIIDAIAAATDGRGDATTIYDIINGSKETISMLFEYLKTSYTTSDMQILFDESISHIKDALDKLGDLEAYFSGNFDNDEDTLHVASFIMSLVSIYIICNPDAVSSNDQDKIMKLVKSGYLYKRLRGYYYRNRDELDQMLNDVVTISLPGEIKSLEIKDMINKYNTLVKRSDHICNYTGTGNHKISDNFTNPLSRLPIKDQVDISELSKISIDDIADAVCAKLCVMKGTVDVIPFNNIDEELLAMYLAEFNKSHPLMIFPEDDHYYISWDGLYYVLFELKTKTTHMDNCLYAIRATNTGTSTLYDLIQFKKSDSVKYVFEY